MSYLSKMANINLPYLHYCPIGVEFRKHFGHEKTIVPGAVCAILSQAVLTQYRHVRQTDGQTHNDGIASWGKNLSGINSHIMLIIGVELF